MRSSSREARRQSSDTARALADGVAVRTATRGQIITVDVFDTLLLRRPVSQRRLFLNFARRLGAFGDASAQKDHALSLLLLRAHWLAFAADRCALTDGEVDFRALLARLDSLCGLTGGDLTADLIERLWLGEEARWLEPNLPLAERLSAARANGASVYAISDTPLSERAVGALMAAAFETLPVDRIFTSCDRQATKRRGGLFPLAATLGGYVPTHSLHIGDDPKADIAVPQSLGIAVEQIPVGRVHRMRRALDGARCVLAPHLSLSEGLRSRRSRKAVDRAVRRDPDAIGRQVFGPIIADLGVKLWLYLAAVADADRSVALFCARGGLTMRRVLTLLSRKMGLEIPVACRDFMVSRLVAARLAYAKDPARATLEMMPIFSSERLSDAAVALVGEPLDLGPEWDAPFAADRFHDLMSAPASAAMRERILEQAALFREHVDDCIGDARRVILVDTGLYGSTLRLLQIAMPSVAWEGVQLARCNYRQGDASHFGRLIGLLVNSDVYDPLDRRSSLLRFWHLFEALFEVDAPSVSRFERDADGSVVSNLEMAFADGAIPGSATPAFAGALSYIEGLQPGCWLSAERDVRGAWAWLSFTLRFPRVEHALLLDPGLRGRDFGLSGSIRTIDRPASRGPVGILRSIHSSRWREGAAARNCGIFRLPVQIVLDLGHCARWAWHGARSKSARRAAAAPQWPDTVTAIPTIEAT